MPLPSRNDFTETISVVALTIPTVSIEPVLVELGSCNFGIVDCPMYTVAIESSIWVVAVLIIAIGIVYWCFIFWTSRSAIFPELLPDNPAAQTELPATSASHVVAS